jgi:hypothetical protein
MQSGDPSRLVTSVPEYRGYTFRDCLSGRGSGIDGGQVYASYSVTWLVLTVNNTRGDVNLESLFLTNGHRNG